MKITMSIAELTQLVITRYMLPSDVQLVVSEKEFHSNAVLLESILIGAGCLTEQGDIKPDKKIASIRLLRETVTNTSLLQAKLAIEDWFTFRNYLRKYGFPDLSSSGYDCVWKPKI